MKIKKTEIEPNKVKNQKKTPKLEHRKMEKNNQIKPTLIKILGSIVICNAILLKLELGQYFEAGSDIIENNMLAGI